MVSVGLLPQSRPSNWPGLASGHHSPLPSSGMAPLLRQLIADYAATGLPPAYLPTDKDIL